MNKARLKTRPPRIFQNTHTYFLTFCTYKRMKILHRYVGSLLGSLEYLQNNLSFILFAYVVLPEHVHLLIKFKRKDDIRKFLNRLKSFTSKQIRSMAGIKDSLWQYGSYDHVIRNKKDFDMHYNYIHINPVKHGIANCSWNWPYSSFRQAVQKGYYINEWGESEVEDLLEEFKGKQFGE